MSGNFEIEEPTLEFNPTILECKFLANVEVIPDAERLIPPYWNVNSQDLQYHRRFLKFNPTILECKSTVTRSRKASHFCLIPPYWNVNSVTQMTFAGSKARLIPPYWNVNDCGHPEVRAQDAGLIPPYWNVNVLAREAGGAVLKV